MPIEVCTVSGYSEMGRNMTALNVDGEVIIFDMGLHMENYVRYTEDMEIENVGLADLVSVGAVPDITVMKDWQKMVKAIIPSHAHLDHVGAIPFLGNSFNAPILCTPFTAAVLRAMVDDQKTHFKNPIRSLAPNSTYTISKNIQIELVEITHSTPHTALVCVHTPYGTVIYANDFKLDLYPVLGPKVNLKKLRKLGDNGVALLIMESTYASFEAKMPSESVARQMLMDVLLGVESKDHAVIVTTFSSHIARLKSIEDMGRQLGRKVVFLGRSLDKYLSAAEQVGIISLSKNARIIKYKRQVNKTLRDIEKTGRGKYLIVVTGHMGEPKAILSRLAHAEMEFKLKADDLVIFSCKVIPTPTNIENRRILEEELKKNKVRIFKDIHVSGHAAREDLRDMLDMLRPKHLIPAHGDSVMTNSLAELAEQMGYLKGKTVHLMKNGDRFKLGNR